ncbi:MAG: hypothetical protein ACP5G6_00500 [Conexivisphaera sp.]
MTSTVGLRFRMYADEMARALRMGPPVVSAELRPPSPAIWQGGGDEPGSSEASAEE